MEAQNWLRSDYKSKHQTYRASNSDYQEREAKRNFQRERSQELKDRRHEIQEARPFIGWDTEGTNVDATPFLFGCSTGDKIIREAIPSKLMFDLILSVEQENPTAIHVIYGGEYDFNMFLRDVPLKNLLALRSFGKTEWDGYRLEHIPRKWFIVSRNGVTAKIFDVVSFFAAPYIQALEEHKIGTDEQRARIAEGKADRRNFTIADIDHIEPYWWDEVQLLPVLMAQVRESFYRAGVYIHQWHGPGAIARYMLREHRIKDSKGSVPDAVHVAARYGFCGGRFESFKAGLIEGEVWNADINSAYPYAATMLPDLSTGVWRKTTGHTAIDPHQFSIHHITWNKDNARRDSINVEPQPLFRRFDDDRVTWPSTVTGWYWSPEAANVVDSPYATIHESWIYESDDSKPFSWLHEYYDHRLALQRLADPMELAFKLGPNSVYGQLAQRAGWERTKKAPPYHQIEWAGYITSWCRAMVYQTAKYCWDQNALISIDTDGVFATCPIPDVALLNGSGTKLGQWKVKSVPGMLNWQSGVYWIKSNDNEWSLKKARGAPKGKIPFSAAMDALPTLGAIHYTRQEMIGYRYALRVKMEEWRFFIEKERSLSFGGSAFSKRWHNPRACKACAGIRGELLHDLYPASNGSGAGAHSTMHVLPWETNDHDQPRTSLDLKNETVIEQMWNETE